MRGVELIARVLALILIASAIWLAFASRPAGTATTRVNGASGDALADLALSPVRRVHLALGEAPNILERDWLVAVRRAGTLVGWSDAGIAPPAAIAITRAADPASAVTIAVAARDTATLRIADTLGVIDSVAPEGIGARITAPAVQGSVRVALGDRLLATGTAPGERVLRPLLVMGSAGWETKFVIAALEERGWTVHTRVRVSPTAMASQGPQLPLDTASYSAILLLDSTSAVAAPSLVRYVRAGGGLVIAGTAARIPALTAIAPARAGAPVAGSLLRSASANGREGLPLFPLVSLRPDAIAIDGRDDHIVAAARREGAGRVITIGETETWRWRMSGGEGAPAEHREWWSRVVASAAYAPLYEPPAIDPEAAPYAALIDALGDPVTAPPQGSSRAAPHLPWWLGVAILLLLLTEWYSRRLRGER